MIYKAEYFPLVEDYTKKWLLSDESIIKFMENTGNSHGDYVDDGAVDCVKNGRSWIFVDWNVKVFTRACYGEKVIVETWIVDNYVSSSVQRNYRILNEQGDVYAVGASKLVLINHQSGKIARIDRDLYDRYQPEKFSVLKTEELPRLVEQDGYDKLKTFDLRHSDIDYNAHLHNLCYLEIAKEMLSAQEYDESDFSLLRLAFHKPLTATDKVNCRYKKIGKTHCFSLYGNTPNVCALIELTE